MDLSFTGVARLTLIGLAIMVLAVSAGCSSQVAGSASSEQMPAVVQGAAGGGSNPVITALDEWCQALPLDEGVVAPTYSGPYASDFRLGYEGACSDLGRRVYADGSITTAELAEVNAAFERCLVGAGFSEVTFLDGGGYSYVNPPGVGENDVRDLDMQCQAITDWMNVTILNRLVIGNPEKIDTLTILAQCMVRTGLQPEGYTAEDYLNDLSSGVYDALSTDDEEKFRSCNDNPAHAG